ncbi:MAG: MotA/TolQ/ExbB proton channel family protein [Bacillota bacterium]|nr:MotA/TolQ/ExbB proton channel family protein [Bacillota bacterium]
MLDIFYRGGPVMYFILLCSILSLAVALERLFYFIRIRTPYEELLNDVETALRQDRPLEAIQIARRYRGPVANVVAAAITRHGQGEKAIREAVQKVGQEEVYQLEKGLAVLEMVGTVSPLLGLLGTVTGLIKSFNVLGALEGIVSPAVLSIGIAEALITTAAGLMVAIPTLAVYTFFSRLVDRHLVNLNKATGEIINLMSGRG